MLLASGRGKQGRNSSWSRENTGAIHAEYRRPIKGGRVRQVAELTEWKERMASKSARAGSGQRRPQVKSDTAAIIKAAADQMEETGQELYVPRLHEELLAKGVAVIRGQNNFYPWIQKHQREIDAELSRRRKAAAKSETPQLSLLNIGEDEI